MAEHTKSNKTPKIKSLDIPHEVLNFIKPDTRLEVFNYILKDYAKRYPQLKLQFAYINTDSESPIDFVVLFKTKSVDGKRNLIVYDIPVIYSDRSLPGFRYCKSQGKEMANKYYEYAINNMTRMDEIKFHEFIEHVANLSLNKRSKKYWKKEQYAKELSSKLFDLSLLYRPEK